jgi:hypothetical protein
MTYTFDQLKEDVRREAEALKVRATKEELGRLSIELLNPHHVSKCVYGLTTGACDSKRAIELISLCAPTMYKSVEGDLLPVGKAGKSMIPYYYSPHRLPAR